VLIHMPASLGFGSFIIIIIIIIIIKAKYKFKERKLSNLIEFMVRNTCLIS
jgi:hypothetical protein